MARDAIAELDEPTYSIVIPAYNEAESLPHLVNDLIAVSRALDGPVEILIVDDGSIDSTYQVAMHAAAKHRSVRVIRLSKNFGHQVALTAGLARTRGRAVITMDADRQHPATVIHEFALRWREGFDVVYGVMTDRPSESRTKQLTSNLFYRVLDRISATPMPANAGDFRLLDREVVNALLRMPERNRYLRGMVSWLGFEQVGVPYACAPRHGGKSAYSMRRMIRFALDAAFSFSTWPLRAGLTLGLAVSALSLLFGIVSLILKFTVYTVPGWTTLIVAVSLLGGVQLMVIGMVGEYVGRVYDEVKGRPLFLTTEGDRLERAAARQSATAPAEPRASSDTA
jgi:polyisoprenyl-phosphate glycosyltransferase